LAHPARAQRLIDAHSSPSPVLVGELAGLNFGEPPPALLLVAREQGMSHACQSSQPRPQRLALVGDGLVFLDPAGQGSGTDNWYWRLSKLGIKAATGGPWEPRDPEGYLKRLRAHSPAVDAVAVDDVTEALRAFNARCYLATSVMLGVASECTVEHVARALVAARGDAAKKLRDYWTTRGPRSSHLQMAARYLQKMAQLQAWFEEQAK
jgi:hypothetical protein